jgi:hypothetical protein
VTVKEFLQKAELSVRAVNALVPYSDMDVAEFRKEWHKVRGVGTNTQEELEEQYQRVVGEDDGGFTLRLDPPRLLFGIMNVVAALDSRLKALLLLLGEEDTESLRAAAKLLNQADCARELAQQTAFPEPKKEEA